MDSEPIIESSCSSKISENLDEHLQVSDSERKKVIQARVNPNLDKIAFQKKTSYTLIQGNNWIINN